MRKYQCKVCENTFETDQKPPGIKCPACNSEVLKRIEGLVPDAGFIKAFLLYESEKCRYCGRKLSSERSIKMGMGPGCAVQFAVRYIKEHPSTLGEGAKKSWTKEEIHQLVVFAKNKRNKK